MRLAWQGYYPAVACEEDDIADQPVAEYLWSDLKARRNALSLWPEGVAPLLGLDLTRYRTYESGGRDKVAPGLVDELNAMEAFVGDEADRLIEGAPAEGTVVRSLDLTADCETGCSER